FHQLLHVLRRGTTGTGFKQATAVNQRNDGEHLGAGTQFQNGEQVGVVVTQHVTGYRDRVFAFTHALQGELGGRFRSHDLNLQVSGVVFGQVLVHLRDQVRVVGPVFIQPEHGRGVGGTCASDSQFHPVADGDVLGLAGAPNVAGLN